MQLCLTRIRLHVGLFERRPICKNNYFVGSGSRGNLFGGGGLFEDLR